MEAIVFADTNLFLDALLNRKPNDTDCINVLEMARVKKVRLYTSSSCLLTVMYFLKKDGMSREDLITVISNLLVFICLATTDEQTFKTGILAGFNDLEDAIQYHTALQIKGIDYFITSNIKDFKKGTGQLPVVTPSQFLGLYRKPRP